MIKLQAREIVRAAKRHGLTLTRNGIGYHDKYCARAVIAFTVLGKKPDLYSRKVWEKLGVKPEVLEELENGFEGFYSENENNRYYKVGKRVAELAGLPERS